MRGTPAHATLAAGCFWCTEAVFERLKGVTKVTAGYAGGTVPSPSYEQVSTGKTGHAEAIQIEFDPAKISYQDLLDVFFATHDPTLVNRQGPDTGPQYRSVIFAHSPEQEAAARRKIADLTAAKKHRQPIATEVVPFASFFPAEDSHQDFYNRNREYGYCLAIIDPKIQKLLKEFPDRVKDAK